MSDANLRVGIDGSGAIAGERIVRRSLDSISNSAKEATGSIGRVESVLSSMGKASENGIRVVKRDLQDVTNNANQAASASARFKQHVLQIGAAAVGIYGVATGFQKIREYARDTIKYLATIETATLGIASAFLVSGQYSEKSTGAQITGQKALIVSMQTSRKVIDELRVANYRTSATLDELIFAYQVTLPVAMAKGFDKKQVKDFTLAMVQAAGAIGLSYDQIAEETRSILTGNVTRNSRIAQILSLNNNQEYLAKVKEGGKALYDYLDDRLMGFKLAGLEVMNTWEGMWSNFRDIARQASGFGFAGLFDDIKVEVKELMNSIMTIDEETEKINWNPEFILAMQTLGRYMQDTFDILVRGTKFMYDHAASAKLAAEIYIKFKLTQAAASLAVNLHNKYVVTAIKSVQESAAASRIRNTVLVQEAELQRTLVAQEQQSIASKRAAFTATMEQIAADTRQLAVSEQKVRVAYQGFAAHKAKATAIRESILLQIEEMAVERQALLLSLQSEKSKVAAAQAERARIREQRAGRALLIKDITAQIAMVEAEQAALKKAAVSNIGTGKFAWSGSGSADPRQMVALLEKETNLRAQLTSVQAQQLASLRAMKAEKALIDAADVRSIPIKEKIKQLEISSIAINRQLSSVEKELALIESQRLTRMVATQPLMISKAALEEAHAVALNMNAVAAKRATGAQIALTSARKLGAGALALVGGWIGLVTVALVAGYWAWDRWGNSAEKAIKKTKQEQQTLADTAKQLEAQLDVMKRIQKIEDAKTDKNIVVTDEDKLKAALGPMDYLKIEQSKAREKDLWVQITEQRRLQKLYADSDVQRYNDALGQSGKLLEMLRKEVQERDAVVGAALAIQKIQEDTAYKANERIDPDETPDAIKRLAKLQEAELSYKKAMNDAELAGNKQKLESMISQENWAFEQGKIAAKEHYQALQRLREEDIQKQIDVAKTNLKEAEGASILSNPSKDIKVATARFAAMEKVVKLQSDLNTLLAEYDKIGVGAAISIEQANKNLIRQYEELNKQIADMSGGTVGVAQLEGQSQQYTDTLRMYQTELDAAIAAEDKAREDSANNAIGQLKRIQAFKEAAAKNDYEKNTKLQEADMLGPYKREQAIIKANHEFKVKMIEEEARLRNVAVKDAADLQMKLDLELRRSSQEMFMAMTKETAYYVQTAGSLFGELANAQDQNSKKGFEAAKNYNIAATVMNTAAAIMQQLATMPGPAGWAGAALAAATGIVQIANIRSTSFGGGGSVSTPGSGAGTADSTMKLSEVNTTMYGSSNDILLDINALQYSELQDISREMRDLNNNITNLVKKIVMDFKGFDAKRFGIDTDDQYRNQVVTSLVNASTMHGLQGEFDNMASSIFGDSLSKIIFPTSMVTNLANGFLKNLMGGDITTSLVGSGISVSGAKLGKILEGMKVNVITYADILTEVDGGWLGDDKSSLTRIYGKAEASFSEVFTTLFTSLANIAFEVAEGLQLDMVDAINNYKIKLKDIDLLGKSSAGVAKTILASVTKAGNKMIKKLFGGVIGQYKELDESWMESAIRIITERVVVEEAIGLSNLKMTDDAIELTQSLIDLSGGFDSFTESFQNYYDAFFSDTEKQIDTYKGLKDVLGTLGMGIPTTADVYRGLVEGLDLSIESNREMYATLLGLSEVAGAFYNNLSSAYDSYYSKFYNEEENQLKLRNDIISEMQKANLILPETRAGYRQLVESLSLTNSVDMERYIILMDLADAADQYYSTLESGLGTLKSFQDLTLESIDIQLRAAETLKSLITGSLSTLSPEDKYNQMKAQFETTKNAALAGDVEAQNSIMGIITEFLGVSKDYYASGDNYVADYNSGVAVLSALSGMTVANATQLDLLQVQIDNLTSLRTAVEDSNLAQIMELRSQTALTTETNRLLNEVILSISGGTVVPIETAGGSFASGTSYVSRDMMANIHEGEIVMDRASADALRRYGIPVAKSQSNNDGVEERLDKVVQKLEDVERRLANIDSKARLAANA